MRKSHIKRSFHPTVFIRTLKVTEENTDFDKNGTSYCKTGKET